MIYFDIKIDYKISKMSKYSELSVKLTNALDKKEKQKFGIFITPQTIIKQFGELITAALKTYQVKLKNILEPACGTCEIVAYFDALASTEKLHIDAVEFNDKIFSAIQTLKFKNKVSLIHQDFLTYNPAKTYELTVSNPPYFVCKKESVPPQYMEYINGRPNIFGLFILHQLAMTCCGGIAAFIIPKSFLNSLYYAKIRAYIKETCRIINIVDFAEMNDFMDTQQETFGLILLKNGGGETPSSSAASCGGETPCPFSVKIGEQYIFTCDAVALKAVFENSTTLAKLGLKVRTGNIAWNQYKDVLTAEPANNTVLLYDTNITKDHKIQLTTFKNTEKFQYIKKEGRQETVIIVKRGHGNSKYKLNYALIDMPANSSYLAENHLNEIYSSDKNMPKKELLALFKRVLKSFENKKTQEFIELFIGNNGLSKTELETIFPIYL